MGSWDPVISVAGLLVGLVVGLTGMGGGALMTPVLIVVFGVTPLAAVSSDVVASFFMKPIGGLVHLRRGTVHLRMVAWLSLGSVPAAFIGVLLLRLTGTHGVLQRHLPMLLGVVLLLAAATTTLKAYLKLRARALGRRGGAEPQPEPAGAVPVRRATTVAIGAVGGLMVGLTSVGAGSVMMVCLLFLYPTLKVGQLVGTDLVQAVPLVGSAAIGHVFLGDFRLGLTTSILIGAIPGVWLGARVSSRTSGILVRRALAVVMLTSGVKLLGVPTGWVLVVAGAAIVVGGAGWAWLRMQHGEDPFVWQQRRRLQAEAAAPPLPAQPRPASPVARPSGSASATSSVWASASRRSAQSAGSTSRGTTPTSTATRNATAVSASQDSST
jgi:uncharacterized protein